MWNFPVHLQLTSNFVLCGFIVLSGKNACFCFLWFLPHKLLKGSLSGGCGGELSVWKLLILMGMVFLFILGGPQSHISSSKMAEFL